MESAARERGRGSSGMERWTKSPSERQIPVLNWKMLTGLVDQNTAIGKLKKGSLKVRRMRDGVLGRYFLRRRGKLSQ